WMNPPRRRPLRASFPFAPSLAARRRARAVASARPRPAPPPPPYCGPPDPGPPGRAAAPSALDPWGETPLAGTKNCWPRPVRRRRGRGWAHSCEQPVHIPARRRILPITAGPEQPEPAARLILHPVIVAHPVAGRPPPFGLEALRPLGADHAVLGAAPPEPGRRTVGRQGHGLHRLGRI